MLAIHSPQHTHTFYNWFKFIENYKKNKYKSHILFNEKEFLNKLWDP